MNNSLSKLWLRCAIISVFTLMILVSLSACITESQSSVEVISSNTEFSSYEEKTPTGMSSSSIILNSYEAVSVSSLVTLSSFSGVSSEIEIIGTFIDERDGEEYATIKIGEQIWMSENLRFLPQVDSASKGSIEDPLYYVYGFSPLGDSQDEDIQLAKQTDKYQVYGVLYNWVAAMGGDHSSLGVPSGVQGPCPKDWHIPSSAEWESMARYISRETGLSSKSGYNWDDLGKLLKSDSELWRPNYGNDDYEFNGLPGGKRDNSGTFMGLGSNSMWWSTSRYDGSNAYYRFLISGADFLGNMAHLKEFGLSVRCIRDPNP